MALLGKGVLAIWNGMQPGFEDAFTRWHVEEHMPERLALPGFERGRRYIALDGHPQFFNFYETETPDVLESAGYKERLNNPSPWTLETVRHFVDTSRTVCDVIASLGRGEGVLVETIEMDTTVDDQTFSDALSKLITETAQRSGIVGVHALRGRVGQDQTITAEKALRGGPDQEVAWLVLVEAVQKVAIDGVRAGALRSDALQQAGASNLKRGLYQLQFALTKTELERQNR